MASDPRITLTRSSLGEWHIELQDRTSGTMVFRGTLGADEFSDLMSTRGEVPVKGNFASHDELAFLGREFETEFRIHSHEHNAKAAVDEAKAEGHRAWYHRTNTGTFRVVTHKFK